VVQLLPNRGIFRLNLALYANYASDFQTAEQEARAIQDPGALPDLPLSFAQMGLGQIPLALESYSRLETVGPLGKSYAASGLGDAAAYEGRFSDAVRLLEQGAAADLASKNANRAAAKFASLAQVQLTRGQRGPALAAADKALTNGRAVKIRFLAARTFVEAGEAGKARLLIAGLAAELQNEGQAYAKVLEGEAALKSKQWRQAVNLLTDANKLFDTWIGHFDLGRAYLEGRQLPQADSQFDECIKRRGEAISLFLDEEPTYSFFPPVYYYQGRVREELKTAGFADSYRTYLAIRGQSKEDPLLPDIRKRVGN
jgi:eukaryotic-like serine/threonine-protein kinase